jgi:hypothetical protein
LFYKLCAHDSDGHSFYRCPVAAPTWDDETPIQGKVLSLRVTGDGPKARANLHSMCLGHWNYKHHGLMRTVYAKDGCFDVPENEVSRFAHIQTLGDGDADMNTP